MKTTTNHGTLIDLTPGPRYRLWQMFKNLEKLTQRNAPPVIERPIKTPPQSRP